MEKTATLNLRINPDVKSSAERVLTQLGVPMATAVDMFLKQVSLTGGIPFAVTLPKMPDRVNADIVDAAQIRQMIDDGLADIENGRVRSAKEAFAEHKKGR
ncbi:MAG: type II toxin-antitoxin system RelB/DinJ family antitoxin [Oscillospiraceae bacterium]|nr:type II toxin-antitoxin system RelB/DinJ family antitoxin [Oscillospiraceae bacterium]